MVKRWNAKQGGYGLLSETTSKPETPRVVAEPVLEPEDVVQEPTPVVEYYQPVSTPRSIKATVSFIAQPSAAAYFGGLDRLLKQEGGNNAIPR